LLELGTDVGGDALAAADPPARAPGLLFPNNQRFSLVGAIAGCSLPSGVRRGELDAVSPVSGHPVLGDHRGDPSLGAGLSGGHVSRASSVALTDRNGSFPWEILKTALFVSRGWILKVGAQNRAWPRQNLKPFSWVCSAGGRRGEGFCGGFQKSEEERGEALLMGPPSRRGILRRRSCERGRGEGRGAGRRLSCGRGDRWWPTRGCWEGGLARPPGQKKKMGGNDAGNW